MKLFFDKTRILTLLVRSSLNFDSIYLGHPGYGLHLWREKFILSQFNSDHVDIFLEQNWIFESIYLGQGGFWLHLSIEKKGFWLNLSMKGWIFTSFVWSITDFDSVYLMTNCGFLANLSGTAWKFVSKHFRMIFMLLFLRQCGFCTTNLSGTVGIWTLCNY